MSGFNMPPGVSPWDIPGNEPDPFAGNANTEDMEALTKQHATFCDRHGDAVIAVQDTAYRLGLERGRREGQELRRELAAVLRTAYDAFAHDDDGAVWADSLIARAKSVLARAP